MYILYTSAQSVHCNTIQLCLSGMHTDLEIIPFVLSPLPCLPLKHLVGNTALSAQRTHREQSCCGPVKQPELFSQQPYIFIFIFYIVLTPYSYTTFLHIINPNYVYTSVKIQKVPESHPSHSAFFSQNQNTQFLLCSSQMLCITIYLSNAF